MLRTSPWNWKPGAQHCLDLEISTFQLSQGKLKTGLLKYLQSYCNKYEQGTAHEDLAVWTDVTERWDLVTYLSCVVVHDNVTVGCCVLYIMDDLCARASSLSWKVFISRNYRAVSMEANLFLWCNLGNYWKHCHCYVRFYNHQYKLSNDNTLLLFLVL